MKRSMYIAMLSFVIAVSNAASSQACVYIPWLDPLAWLGFYGCGYGCGGYGYPGYSGGYSGYSGYGYGGYGCGYQPQPYAQPMVPQMTYPVAPVTSGCNCTGAMPQQQVMTAVQVPVTTYRAVTQYVPQTTYQTRYQPAAQAGLAYSPTNTAFAPYGQSQVAFGGLYGQPSTAFSGAYSQPQIAYGPAYSTPTYATPTYGSTLTQTPTNSAPLTSYGSVGTQTFYPTPQVSPPPTGIASPVPATDINGDHEYPSQSAVAPQPRLYNQGYVRPASYGVTPRSARTYSASVR